MTYKICTCNVPEFFILKMKHLIDGGWYASRSELIRIALREFAKKEIEIWKQHTPESKPPLIPQDFRVYGHRRKEE